MIEPAGPLSLSRQSVLPGVSRSSLYYRWNGESAENLALMRRIDGLHMGFPFYGIRRMMRHLRREGVTAGRHRLRRLMRLMGMQAVYRRPRTSVVNSEHRVFPYLLRPTGCWVRAWRSRWTGGAASSTTSSSSGYAYDCFYYSGKADTTDSSSVHEPSRSPRMPKSSLNSFVG